MDKIIEIYGDCTLQVYTNESRGTPGKYMGNYEIIKGGLKVVGSSIDHLFDGESEAASNALRLAKEHVDERLSD